VSATDPRCSTTGRRQPSLDGDGALRRVDGFAPTGTEVVARVGGEA
jgi:hypothetical protein